MSDEKQALEASLTAKMGELAALKQEIDTLRRAWAAAAEPVGEYAFDTPDGPVTLRDLFGDQDDLIVVHNMGRGCAYCTLWADGFVGLLPHLASRAAFVVSTPDDPATQRAFAASRAWPFRMVSVAGTSFARDMGFLTDSGDYWPGVSTFHRRPDGTIARVGRDVFGPGDTYCGVWHFFDLLPGGAEGWEPRFSYTE